jgi:hypothetical protein
MHVKYQILHIQQLPPDDEQLLYSKHVEDRLFVDCLLFVFLALQPTVVVFSQPGSGI